jgi:hypothetical protein
MSTYRAGSARTRALTTAVIAVVVLLVAAVVSLAVLHIHSSNSASNKTKDSKSSSTSGSNTQTNTEAVAWTSPKSGSTGVSPAGPITVHLTQPLAPGSPMPTISPSISGSWALTSATTLTFEPTASLIPFVTYTVTVPGGSNGLRDQSGSRLASNVHIGFKVAAGSFLRLQQLLAELDYLPVSFAPTSTAPVPATQEAISQVGNFNWRWPNLPGTLTTLFVEGGDDVLTRGAVMNFENQNGLATDGIAGPEVWTDLLKAVAAHQMDPNTYDWIYVQKTPLPEEVYAFVNGKLTFKTVANTGATGFITPDGSWPVYLHYASTTMQGTNPDGTHYDDKNVLWVSYFYDGDALHAFERLSYGTPQSLGCVEMPTASAATVWPLTPIGTVVTIQ